jgi:SM-20-related protein
MLTSDTSFKFEQLTDGLFDQGYVVLDHFISLDDSQKLLDEMLLLRGKGRLHQAGTGRADGFQRNPAVRGDEIKWIENRDQHPMAAAFLDQLEAYIDHLNATCYSGIRDYEAHYAAYPVGSFYKRHLDQFKSVGNRQYTFIFYLNLHWQKGDGGELRMYISDNGEEKAIEIEPIGGRIVMFKSDEFEHEVLPTQKERYSITGWFLKVERSLSFLL